MGLQVKEQLAPSCPATKAQRTEGQVCHENCNSGGMSARCSTHRHVSAPERQTWPDKRGPVLHTKQLVVVSPVAACKGQTHRDFCHSGIFRGLAKTHSSHALELVLLVIRLTPDPRLLVPLSFQPVCLGQVPSCEAESDHSHGYIY